jgi:hypothetical protein
MQTVFNRVHHRIQRVLVAHFPLRMAANRLKQIAVAAQFADGPRTIRRVAGIWCYASLEDVRANLLSNRVSGG